ncbi:MAG: hypothetical protein FJ038_02760 [Chloroflexi bacterium]|nr:hypothetical protein [Chloroflexota bacterium]
MSRVLGFILHNWPLKLAAVALATILYAGLVLSQNARVWPGRVPIQVLNQPSTAFIVGQLEDVTNIRYFAPTDAADRLSSAAFTAWIDLKDVQINPDSPLVTVEVQLRVSDPAVDILDFRPRRITVRLDPVVARTVPVQVAQGVVPEGLEVSPAMLSQQTVTLTGPQSVVSQVVAAEAQVRIQASGIDVDQLVDLIAVDARGEQLTPVEIQPSAVRVRIEVSADVTTKTVPIAPVVTGVPASGFTLDAATVEPTVITVSGNADVLSTLTSVPTKPVAIDGASADLAAPAEVELPEGVSAVGGRFVTVTVRLRETEATRTITAGLVLVGAESDRTYILGVESVLVTIGGTERALTAMAPGSFTGVVDVTAVAEGQQAISVRVTLPDGVRLIAVSPPEVTVFVSPRATPPPTPSPSPTPPASAPTTAPAAAPTNAPQPSPAGASPPPGTESPSPAPSAEPSPSV